MPRLLDLFCGAGGAGMGYARAGFEVVGVDNRPQPNYPFPFHEADALTFPLDGFDVVHASPPCQHYSPATPDRTRDRHPDLIDATRERLRSSGVTWVIENVELAPLHDFAIVCGSFFGLPIKRHRWFESNLLLLSTPCSHWTMPKDVPIYRHGSWYLSRFVNIYGTGGGKARDRWPEAMGIDWMTKTELREAIPPAYTQFIGTQLLAGVSPVAG